MAMCRHGRGPRFGGHDMHRFMKRAALALCTLAGLALPAFADEVTFVMNNHHPNAVEVQLYSDSRDHV